MSEKLRQFIASKLRDGPALARSYTQDTQTGILRYRHAYYRLKKFVNEFIELPEYTNRWIILYGLRGIGKTTILFQIYEELIKKGIDSRDVLYIAADDLTSYADSTIADAISLYLAEIHGVSIPQLTKKVFLLIDEAHFDKKWESAIKTLYDQNKNAFILVSGSSAIALRLSTDSTRRSMKEALYPLNFAEYGLMRYDIFPPRYVSNDLKKLILNCDLVALKSLQEKEKVIAESYSQKKISLPDAMNHFLLQGGFACAVNIAPAVAYAKVMEIITRVVRTDIPQIQGFNTDTLNDIMRIIGHLAIKKPGETSHGNVAQDLGLSPTKVKDIFDCLEATHLVFSVKPKVTKASNYAKAPWKYYYLSTSIISALRHNIGHPTFDGDAKGLIYETAVASSLFRFKETGTKPIDIFYDKQDGGVDFLMQNMLSGEIVPIEVGANKGPTQVLDAMSRHNSKYGIIVTDVLQTTYDLQTKIIWIPISTFILI